MHIMANTFAITGSDKKLTGAFTASVGLFRLNPTDPKSATQPSVVQQTKGGMPFMLVQIDEGTKKLFAELLECQPSDLENAEGNSYLRINLPANKIVTKDPDTGRETISWELIGQTLELLALTTKHTFEVEVDSLRPRAYLITNPKSPYCGETRFEATGDLVKVIKASRYNWLAMPKGTVTKEQLDRQARAQAERRLGVVGAAAQQGMIQASAAEAATNTATAANAPA
jgi:hypothetical protein